MPGHPRLFRRGATYYHRAAIPADIKDTYPKREETFSLKTKDPREAVKRVREAAARVDRLFESHRRQVMREAEPALPELSEKQLELIRGVYYAHLLDEDDELRTSGFEDKSFEENADDLEELDAFNRGNYARGQYDSFFRAEAEEVLTWTNVNLRLAVYSPSWRRLIRVLQEATIEANEAKKARNVGDVVRTPSIPTQTDLTNHTTPLLSEAIGVWVDEKSRSSWTQKTADDHRIWSDRFVLVAGDKKLEAYGKAEARSFKDLLLSLPANWTIRPELQGMTVAEAATKAADLGLPPMSHANANKILGFVGSFWNWAKHHYDGVAGNPFEGMKLKKNTKAREERHPFTVEELNAIFRAPIYTGCQNIKAWLTPGDEVLKDAGLYWVPLIALYTGARSGEIIQLYTTDVKVEEGILRFEMTDEGDDQRLKTSTSHRFIPVHPELQRLGLPELIERRRRQGAKRLFPEMAKGADGYYSSPYSRQFRRLLDATNVKHSRNSFHSFRHNFEDVCRSSGISLEVMNALQGHSEVGMAGRYGRGFDLNSLHQAVCELRYEELELSHLRCVSF